MLGFIPSTKPGELGGEVERPASLGASGTASTSGAGTRLLSSYTRGARRQG